MDQGTDCYRRYLHGEENAFDEIMQEYFLGLVYFVNRYLRDVAAAEDVAMDVFADLIVHRHRYNFRSSLKTYLYMRGRSRALNVLKQRSRMSRLDDLSPDDAPRAEDAELLEAVLTDERKRTLHAALEKLPEGMREAVQLVLIQGLTYDQAGAVMKKNAKQVDNLLYRAKKELRTILNEEDASCGN